ncbi:MAG TPA: O-antigen ligase family protein [Bryobacteraceae bacterium]|nr:O-antigen ligase family protein [Bryobacteraceae bacterium]
MNAPEPMLTRAARWLTFCSAASILFSIAISQIFLGAALVALAASRGKPRMPRIQWLLALFILGTLIAWFCSGDPLTHGWPQVRKCYVFAEWLVIFSCLRDAGTLRRLFASWAGIGAATALVGFAQFAGKVREAHEIGANFYQYYTVQRITGFASHWNTYSSEEMFALIMTAAFLFFAPLGKRRWPWIACAALTAAAVVLSDTRGVWIASAVAAVYLVFFWRRWLCALVPVALVAAYLAAPAPLKERANSIVHPTGVDSNEFRLIVWRAGVAMVEKHPWLGLGPDGPKFHMEEYVPPEVWRSRPAGFYQHVHNVYLQWAADRGLPTALVMLILLIRIPIDFWRGLRALPPGRSLRRFLLHGAAAVVLAVMVEGFVEYNLGDSEVLAMFLVATGCGYLALEGDLADA